MTQARAPLASDGDHEPSSKLPSLTRENYIRVRRSHLSTCVEGRRCVNPLKSRVILKIRVFRALEHQPCPQERAFPRVISSSRRRAKIALASRFMLSFTSLPPDFIGVHSTGSYNTEPKCRFYQKLHCKLRLTNKSSFAS